MSTAGGGGARGGVITSNKAATRLTVQVIDGSFLRTTADISSFFRLTKVGPSTSVIASKTNYFSPKLQRCLFMEMDI